jgi:hypothetical protein
MRAAALGVAFAALAVLPALILPCRASGVEPAAPETPAAEPVASDATGADAAPSDDVASQSAGTGASQAASAPAAPATPAPATIPSDNRLIVSGNGSTLYDPSSGGGGGSVTYLQDFSSGLLGIGGQYQTLANAHWEFGSLTGALNFGNPGDKWNVYGEADEGVGDIGEYLGLRRFDYNEEAAGVDGTFGSKVTVQLETRQYDIDTAHGNLPKIGVGVLWTPHFETTVSYAHSVTGNLGTQLTTLRLDYLGPVNWVVGGATGFASPPIVNFETGATGPAPSYREGYLGLSKAFRRVDWAILADYLKLGEVKRITLTLTCTLHLSRGSSAK